MLDYPYHFDSRGRTAQADDDDHLRDLIEQLLFTAPGERVNRPDFGSGLRQLVFAPNSTALASATQLAVQSSLQRWLGDRIVVNKVEVAAQEEILRIEVSYTVLRTGQNRTASFANKV